MDSARLKNYVQQDSFLEFCMFVVALLGPIMTIPQLGKIWMEKQVEGISLLTWSMYLVLAVVWIGYGVKNKNKPIVFSNCLNFCINLAVVVGIVLLS